MTSAITPSGVVMKRAVITILLLGVAFWGSFLVSHIFRNDLLDLTYALTGMALMICLPITMGVGIYRCGFFSPSWLPAPLLCVAFFLGLVFLGPFGRYLTNRQFQRQLGEYTSVIDDVKTGHIPTGNRLATLDLSHIAHLPRSSTA